VETPEGLIPVTLSLGVVALESVEGVSSETLVRVADTALYRAKISGRNRVVMATSQDVKRELVKPLHECESHDPDEPLRDLPTSSLPVSDAAGDPAL
jgi:predicted signal transduction protein with EAL and GGDEF domain